MARVIKIANRMRFLIFLSLLFSPLFGNFSLKNVLKEAEAGTFLLYEQGKNILFLRVVDKKENLILLEEISLPSSRFFRQNLYAREWYLGGAQGNTSWTLAKIDLETISITKLYSLTKRSYIDSAINSFFPTLFNLNFEEVPLSKRKKCASGIWNPPLTVEGVRSACDFNAFWGTWPNDRSELSNKKIEIYLPKNQGAFFPYFLELEGKIGYGKVCALDSGKLLNAPLAIPPDF